MDLANHARSFARSVCVLTSLPRAKADINCCESRFLASWELALEALCLTQVDLSGAFAMGVALRRSGLPADTCRLILEFAIAWPQFIGDGPRKRRRMCH